MSLTGEVSSSAEHGERADEVVDLKKLIEPAEHLAALIDQGTATNQELQPRITTCLEELAELTLAINRLGLYSSNETVEDVATESLRYLLVPCYFGLAHHQRNVEIQQKSDELQKAKIYYRDFLKRLKNLEIISFSLQSEETDLNGTPDNHPTTSALNGEERRRAKIERFKQQKELSETMQRIRQELKRRADDESLTRDLYLAQLKYWADRVVGELESIEDELPLLRMMAERAQAGQGAHPPVAAGDSGRPKTTWKPFILTRDAAQKAVFGLGYPSVPTLTVDEWAQQRFGANAAAGPQSSTGQQNSAQPDEDEDLDEEAEERERRRKMEWDEYKDTHRRGWGNTHNKG